MLCQGPIDAQGDKLPVRLCLPGDGGQEGDIGVYGSGAAVVEIAATAEERLGAGATPGGQATPVSGLMGGKEESPMRALRQRVGSSDPGFGFPAGRGERPAGRAELLAKRGCIGQMQRPAELVPMQRPVELV